jgi:hypothetical protein
LLYAVRGLGARRDFTHVHRERRRPPPWPYIGYRAAAHSDLADRKLAARFAPERDPFRQVPERKNGYPGSI